MIRVKEKHAIFLVIGLLSIGFLYLSTMWNFLQAITNATIVIETLLWILTAWTFNKITIVWFKMVLTSLVWEKD